MRITDELREVAAKTECANGRCEKLYRGDLERIADRIDAEHERTLANEWIHGVKHAQSDDAMAKYGYVKLPVDADGEPIHVGDVMENIICPSVHREVTGVGAECFYGWDEGNGRYSQFDANRYRHHHAPTVEDVLEELLREYDRDDSELKNGEIVERFAAKLRLADE